jgi:hypothetical protein
MEGRERAPPLEKPPMEGRERAPPLEKPPMEGRERAPPPEKPPMEGRERAPPPEKPPMEGRERAPPPEKPPMEGRPTLPPPIVGPREGPPIPPMEGRPPPIPPPMDGRPPPRWAIASAGTSRNRVARVAERRPIIVVAPIPGGGLARSTDAGFASQWRGRPALNTFYSERKRPGGRLRLILNARPAPLFRGRFQKRLDFRRREVGVAGFGWLC